MTYQQRIIEQPSAPTPVKLRVQDYLRLEEAGAFDEYAKVELIDGVVIAMNAEQSRHSRVKSELGFLIRLALRTISADLIVDVEPTLSLPPHDMPEPDLMVLDGRGIGPSDYYGIANVKLVVEVSSSSIARDLGDKHRLYAAAGVPEYWVVDLSKDRLHQFSGPDPDGYTQHRTVPIAGELRSITLPDLAVDGAGLI